MPLTTQKEIDALLQSSSCTTQGLETYLQQQADPDFWRAYTVAKGIQLKHPNLVGGLARNAASWIPFILVDTYLTASESKTEGAENTIEELKAQSSRTTVQLDTVLQHPNFVALYQRLVAGKLAHVFIEVLWEKHHQHISTFLTHIGPCIDTFHDKLEPKDAFFGPTQYPTLSTDALATLNLLRVYHQAAYKLPFDDARHLFSDKLCAVLLKEHHVNVQHISDRGTGRRIYDILLSPPTGELTNTKTQQSQLLESALEV